MSDMAMHMVDGMLMTESAFQTMAQMKSADARKVALAQLRRCPFCGGRAELHYIEQANRPYICCDEVDKCRVHPSTDTCDTVEEAIKIWNTRYNG